MGAAVEALLNFVLGGGLLAFVQAALTAWGQYQARQAGGNAVALASDEKALADVNASQNIDGHISADKSGDVANQLQEFTRD